MVYTVFTFKKVECLRHGILELWSRVKYDVRTKHSPYVTQARVTYFNMVDETR
jgi:hypothetical protein